MSLYVKSGNNWSKVQNIYVKSGNIWNTTKTGYIRDANTWKPFFNRVRPTTWIITGGGGGSGQGGGGAAGWIGFNTFTPESMRSYAVTIGAAGNGGNVNGGNSVFNGFTAYGGGGGGTNQGWNGNDGASGGGGGQPNRGQGGAYGGAGTPGQGGDGGRGRDDGEYPYCAGSGGGYYGSPNQALGCGTGPGVGIELPSEIRSIPPFNANSAYYLSNGGEGWGQPGSGLPDSYGSGAHGGSGAGRGGVAIFYYSGTQIYSGGNYITYQASTDRTYHVFTSSGILQT